MLPLLPAPWCLGVSVPVWLSLLTHSRKNATSDVLPLLRIRAVVVDQGLQITKSGTS